MSESAQDSFAVFPFLKTHDSIEIGNYVFRSTDASDGLSAEQARVLREVADMLFLKDGLRIASASYAVIPFVDLTGPAIKDLTHLKRVQAVVAYTYASPHETSGDPFRTSEHASMVILSPGMVPIYVVRPDFHVVPADQQEHLVPDAQGRVSGYFGYYNFKHHFWVTKGSRIYGSRPHVTLNQSQDLSADLDHHLGRRRDSRLLRQLLSKPESQFVTRIFTAVRWFNRANSALCDDEESVVHLSIAFESLLGLPSGDKTDRVVDAIALLLGRFPRLDIWAQQFYDARSQIVHEGQFDRVHFVATDIRRSNEGPKYRSLLSYGRQVFQLSLGTLLTGAELAESADLHGKLVANSERFQQLCRLLSDQEVRPDVRLESVRPIVHAIGRYKFVWEDSLRLDAVIAATRLAAKALVDQGSIPSPVLEQELVRLTKSKRDDPLEALEAIKNLDAMLPDDRTSHRTDGLTDRELPKPIEVVGQLVRIVWGYVFEYYFWLKREHSDPSTSPSG